MPKITPNGWAYAPEAEFFRLKTVSTEGYTYDSKERKRTRKLYFAMHLSCIHDFAAISRYNRTVECVEAP
jgi:hypothetical protein